MRPLGVERLPNGRGPRDVLIIVADETAMKIVENEDFDVLIVLGAGDLDNYCDEITEILKRKYC